MSFPLPCPKLETPRLILRPFELADAREVQRQAGHRKVYDTTANIPHPYPDGAAEEWISLHPGWYAEGVGIQFAVTLKSDGRLIGCVSLLGISRAHQKAEIGYWIGVDHWANGYCTEASQALLHFTFSTLGLNKVFGRHVAHNPASGKVMEKIGMEKVAVLKEDFCRDGVFHDMVLYEIIRSDWIDA